MADRTDGDESRREWEPHLGEGHPLGRRETDHLSNPPDTDRSSNPRETEHAPDPVDTSHMAESGDTDGRRVSRRHLLVGGGGLGIAALVGGIGWWMQQDSTTGAERLAESFVQALASNDWATIEEMFHEDTVVMGSIRDGEVEDYEAYLDEQGRLELLSTVSPTVDGIQTVQHIPDVTEDAVDDLFLRRDPDPDVVEEYKTIVVFTNVETDVLLDIDGPDEEELTHFGEEIPLLADLAFIHDGTEWTLWDEQVTSLV